MLFSRLLRLSLQLVLLLIHGRAVAVDTGWLRPFGQYEYSDPANWVGGVVNNVFDDSLTLQNELTLQLSSDYTTTGDLHFAYQQGYPTFYTYIAPASARQTLTLGGDIHFNPQPSEPGARPTLFLGDSYALDVNLGGATREMEVGAGSFVRTDDNGVVSNGRIVKSGEGHLMLQGINSFAGGVEVRGGKLTANGAQALGTGTLEFTAPAQFVAETPISNSTLLAADLTLTDYSMTHTGPVDLAGGTRTITMDFSSAADVCQFYGTFANGGLVVARAPGRGGRLVLLGSNSHAGGTTVTTGSLALGNKAALGSGPLILNNGATISGEVAFGDPPLIGVNAVPNPVTIAGNITAGSSSGPFGELELSGPVFLGNQTRTIAAREHALTLSGVVSGDPGVGLGVATTNTGTLILTNANTFDGGVTLNSGYLVLRNREAAGSGTLTLAGGNLTFNSGVFTGPNAFRNPIAVRGGGSIVGPVELAGPIELASGTLRIANASSAAITLSGEITGGLSGVLSLGADSGREIVITGANTYSGDTRIEGGSSSGSIVLGHKAALGTGRIRVLGKAVIKSSVALTGVNSIANSLLIGSDFTFGSAQPMEFAGTVDLVNGNRMITLSNGAPVTWSGAVGGSGVNGAVTLDGTGSLRLSGANTYTGATNVRGGTLLVGADAFSSAPGPLGNAASPVTLGHTTGSGSASLLTEGPVTIARSISVPAGVRSVTLGGATPNVSTFSGNIALGRSTTLSASAGGKVHFTGTVFGGNVSVSKSGFGVVTLENANAYAGSTFVTAGTLLVNNVTGSGTGSGKIAVGAGRLGGTGTLSGSVTVGDDFGTADAILSPGDGIGALRTGPVGFRSDGVFEFQIDSTLQRSDRVLVTGSLALGSARFSPSDVGAATLPAGFEFVLFENTSGANTTGQFFGLNENSPVQIGANYFTLDYDTAVGADGLTNDVIARVVNVPEPGTAVLVACGAILSGAVRSRPGHRA